MRTLAATVLMFAALAMAPTSWAFGMLEDSCACGGTKVLVAQAYNGDGWYSCLYRYGDQYWVDTIYGGCPG